MRIGNNRFGLSVFTLRGCHGDHIIEFRTPWRIFEFVWSFRHWKPVRHADYEDEEKP